MTGDEDGRAARSGESERERPRDAPPEEAEGRRGGLVPDPEPEEAPELLGGRSDYPIAWDGEEDG